MQGPHLRTISKKGEDVAGWVGICRQLVGKGWWSVFSANGNERSVVVSAMDQALERFDDF